MGEQASIAFWARSSFWKSAVVIAPMAAAGLFLASGTQAQTSGNAPPPTTEATTVVPKPTPDAARSKGPKLRDKVDRVTAPSPTTDPTAPTQASTPVAPIDAPDAARGKNVSTQPKMLDAEPKARVANPTPAADSVDQTTERRREGPKGDVGHGRTETPAPDTQPAGRGAKPKGAGGHGRTATTPLALGALVSFIAAISILGGGDDGPSSP